MVGAPPEAVWAILTDYDNLATHVPNLVTSELRPHPNGGTRLFQEGAQKIVGVWRLLPSVIASHARRGSSDRCGGCSRLFRLPVPRSTHPYLFPSTPTPNLPRPPPPLCTHPHPYPFPAPPTPKFSRRRGPRIER